MKPVPPPRLPWLAVSRGIAVLLGALVVWSFRQGLSEGLAAGTSPAWIVGLAAAYGAVAIATRWRVGLAVAVLAGAAGVLMSYAAAALVAIGGSVAMSAEAVRSGRTLMAVLALIGLLHAILAGAALMALLHANRVLQSQRGDR